MPLGFWALARRRLFGGLEGEAHRVDAVPQIGRCVVALTGEHVAEVRVAAGATHLGARTAGQAVVSQQPHPVPGSTGEERRPSAVRGELVIAAEQLGATGLAAVSAGGRVVGVLAGEGTLGAAFAQYVELQGAELAAPLLGGLDDGQDHGNSSYELTSTVDGHRKLPRTLCGMPTPAIDLEIDGRQVRLSSPDKPYFDELGITKRGVADYFLAVGPGILNALRNRPTTMERWPGGVREGVILSTRADSRGEAFYQKRAPANTPEWVQTASITFPSGRTAVEVAPGDLASILWMVNLGTVRFHPWPVRAADTDAVDQLRIDLDPQPGSTFAMAIRAAVELRQVLFEVGLTGFCKTSGGRGLHVFAPILPTDFIAARHAAIAVGRELARRLPSEVTVNWWKEERGQRIFVDFNQMARDRLMTSAYSIRPTPLGRVSAPVTWEELPDCDPADFTVVTMPVRFAQQGDLWQALEECTPGSPEAALAWYQRDAARGEGEMPYPPEYPKMPGEPMRVQPSRARRDDS